MAIVNRTSEVVRLRIDALASGQLPSFKITDLQGNVEISGLLMKDVTDLIYALKQAQLQVVAMITKTSNSGPCLQPDNGSAD
jgi:hypothetical protein